MRKFKTYTYHWDRHADRKMIGKATQIVVADALNNDEVEVRTVATFPVSDLYPEDQQKALADVLCNFLNGRLEAIEKTFEGDALLQRIIL